MDRLIGLVALVLMAIATYLMFVRGQIVRDAGEETRPARREAFRASRTCDFWTAVAAAVVVLTNPADSPPRPGEASAGCGACLAQGLGTAAGDEGGRGHLLVAALDARVGVRLTIFSQSTVILAFWLLGRNLGIQGGLTHYFVVFPVMWVVSAVPVSIAGLGVFEAGMVEIFGLLAGVPAEQAMVLALCQRFVWVLASLPGGLIHLVGAHLPREEISVDCKETAN